MFFVASDRIINTKTKYACAYAMFKTCKVRNGIEGIFTINGNTAVVAFPRRL